MAWFYIAADTPNTHPRIAEEEKKYITGSVEYNTDKRVIYDNGRSKISSVSENDDDRILELSTAVISI